MQNALNLMLVQVCNILLDKFPEYNDATEEDSSVGSEVQKVLNKDRKISFSANEPKVCTIKAPIFYSMAL